MIGFVNGDGIGSVGLEAKYDDTLTGTAGYTVSARNASGSSPFRPTSNITMLRPATALC
ncbi:MAG: hypothetical protein V8R27_06465 [Oscillospiraceae bacterium]